MKLFKFILKLLKNNFYVYRFLRILRPFSLARPAWKSVVNNSVFPPINEKATKILLATSTGSHWAMSGFESVLAAALRLRGSSIEVLLCDGILPACQECDIRLFPNNRLIREGTAPLCKNCFAPAEKMFSEIDILIRKYSKYLNEEKKHYFNLLVEKISDADIKELKWKGIAVGEHAFSGTLRFFGRGTLSGEKFGYDVLRQYLRASLYTAAALDHLLSVHKYDVVVFHHGIYVPQGVIGDVCRLHNVRVVNWNPAYRESCFLFSHDDSYHKTMITEPPEICFGYEWNDAKEATLMTYLESRSNGSNDWISYQRETKGENKELLEKLGIKSNKLIIGVLTNVMWDAQLHFKKNAFESMLEWIYFTVEYFLERTDIELLIRIHPAEVLGNVPSRQHVLDEIRKRWNDLPKHIHLVLPDDSKNTYELMKFCDTVLVYGTKMSIELPCWGIPVVVAGEAWARGKGFTIDVSSVDEYQKILHTLPIKKRLNQDKILLAKKYAYHIFYRRMIPVKFAKKNKYLVPFSYNIASIDDLQIGRDPGLDIICNSILSGSPFVIG